MKPNDEVALDVLELPASIAQARIVGNLPRARRVFLEWPIEFGGRVYATIEVRRLDADGFAAFLDAPPGTLPAMFFDENGEPLPLPVMAALDPDDDQTVRSVMLDLLPRALRQG
jgi:hypothetical protein